MESRAKVAGSLESKGKQDSFENNGTHQRKKLGLSKSSEGLEWFRIPKRNADRGFGELLI